MIGLDLGPYHVVAKLGAGGMGEVYRARDTRLQRDVALKTLPTADATDPARVDRFYREAWPVAALTHANIVTIYSVEGNVQRAQGVAAGSDNEATVLLNWQSEMP